MANPGPYQMGQPMGGAPMQNMGGPPMGQMGMMPRPPMRQGTSKIVPVVVSAGLAVGVFCGLLFGLGTAKTVAAPEKASNNAKRADEVQVFQPESHANPNVKIPDKNAPKAGSNAGSNAVAQAGTGSAAAAEPAVKPTKLVVEIKPEAAAQTAKVLIDGNPIEGLSTEFALDPGTSKKVKVTVKANGYKDIEQEVDVEGESVTVKLDLIKGRSTPTATAATGEGGGATTGGAAQTPTAGGTGATGATGGGGGGTGGGSKASGGTKSNSNSNSGKSGKSSKGSGGLIDI
jgi:hypothetical protein